MLLEQLCWTVDGWEGFYNFAVDMEVGFNVPVAGWKWLAPSRRSTARDVRFSASHCVFPVMRASHPRPALSESPVRPLRAKLAGLESAWIGCFV